MIMLTGDDLAYAALDYIREHPEEWDQDSYFDSCGTVACFAGRAILLALGHRPPVEEMAATPLFQVAQELLGWSYEQADAVFYYWTTDFAQLEKRVKQVLNGEIA
jgi:hypothetical protein